MNAPGAVLLVEDNPGDARLVAEYLGERFGDDCKLLHVPTLAAGLQVLDATPVDVVLLDLGLPDSSGLDAYFRISQAAPRAPVVILTGEDDDEQALRALRVGAEDYLAKQGADGVSLVRAMRHAIERRRASDLLRDSEARFRAIVETAEEGILKLDRSGEVLYANARAMQLLGLELAAAAGLAQHAFPAGSFQRWVATTDRIAAAYLLRTPPGERATCELRLVRDDRSPVWVVAAAGGIAARPGTPCDVVLLLTDITGRKMLEEDLRALKADLERRVMQRTAMLEAANAELQAISRAMAHDLRNPLNGIIGLSRLVRQDPASSFTADTARRLQLVEQSALDMNELIAALLALGALGRHEIGRESVNLSALAYSVAHRLAQAEPQRQVDWRIRPDVHAEGDRSLLASVVQNLIDNAWKFTSRTAAAVIEFGLEADGAQSPAYFVRDNGVGFETETAGELFEPFRRLSSARDFAGTGLGLAGARRIVERHGGRMWAESEPSLRTTFYFTLGGAGTTGGGAQ